MNLRLDWATHQAALYAVKNWHYSRSLPPGPLVKIGVWEDGRFIGVLLFSRGATKNLLKPYRLSQIEGCELTRIALRNHRTAVSRIISVGIKLLKQSNPGLRLIVSFADPDQGHHGGIYQGSNWIYAGEGDPSYRFIEKSTGREWHPRMVSKQGIKKSFGKIRRVVKQDDCYKVHSSGKHRYLMPLDKEMLAQILPLAKPYPKRPKQATTDALGTAAVQR